MYASWKLKIHEKNYTKHGLELGAVVFTLKIWKHVLETRSVVLWAEIREIRSIGLELVQETTNKELNVGDKEMLEVSFGKMYLELDSEVCGIIDVGSVVLERCSAFWKERHKCLADANLHVPLDEIKIDKTLHFVEEPVEIMDCEVRSLKRSKISLVKVCWNSKHGPEFTWEREDHMKSKYP
ncbi:putative reverse transcriptase domain-containing protein [Tanacetum coccineum]